MKVTAFLGHMNSLRKIGLFNSVVLKICGHIYFVASFAKLKFRVYYHLGLYFPYL